MSFLFSSVKTLQKMAHGGNFAAARVDPDSLHDFMNPVVGFDHFWMNGPTFAPHPHAGFSAISYLFEDSKGALRNRDSLGHDILIQPGEMVWTQAGSGVIHDEKPESPGHTVHGLQLFVNLSAKNKQIAPKVFQLRAAEVSVAQDAEHNRVRVLVGMFAGLRSAVSPAEPFEMFDMNIHCVMHLDVRKGWNTLVFVLDGTLQLGTEEDAPFVRSNQIVGFRSEDDSKLELRAAEPTHALVLSGPANREPLVMQGPFIMNSEAEIMAAMERFQSGQMGHLIPS